MHSQINLNRLQRSGQIPSTFLMLFLAAKASNRPGFNPN